jgi:hypothetical protein
MVDPSVFATPMGLEWIESVARQREGIRVSRSLLSIASDRRLSPAALAYFGLRDVPYTRLRAALETFELSSQGDETPPTPDAAFVVERLHTVIRDPLVADILSDEYLFLMTHSTVLARVKKPFTDMSRAGASFVQVVTRRTLHLPPGQPLTSSDYRRASIKWIAVGGSAASAFVSPVAAAALGLGTGFFLLLDP